MIFDKHYYYLAKLYRKISKNNHSWESQTILALSSTQFVICLDLYMLIDAIYPSKKKLSNSLIFFFTLIAFSIFIYNYKRYDGKFEIIESKVRLKKMNDRLETIIVIITILFAWIFIFFAAIVFGRFGN